MDAVRQVPNFTSTDQKRQTSQVVRDMGQRLMQFIRARVPTDADAEDDRCAAHEVPARGDRLYRDRGVVYLQDGPSGLRGHGPEAERLPLAGITQPKRLLSFQRGDQPAGRRQRVYRARGKSRREGLAPASAGATRTLSRHHARNVHVNGVGPESSPAAGIRHLRLLSPRAWINTQVALTKAGLVPDLQRGAFAPLRLQVIPGAAAPLQVSP